MRAGRALRQIVIARIKDEVPDLGGRVFDHAARTTPAPYVTLGTSYGLGGEVQCVGWREITLQIDVWHKVKTKGALEDVVDDITACLRGWADTDALTMHPIRIALIRIIDDADPDWVHGVVQVEALVEV